MTEGPAQVRLFLALDLDPEALRRIAGAGERLRSDRRAPKATWTAAERMHLTLKFFGDVDAELVPEIAAAVRPLAEGWSAPTLRVEGLGAFPNPARARVLVAALREETESVVRLAAEIEALVEPLGFAREGRPFRPHVTLARLKLQTDVRKWLAPESGADLGECAVTALAIYESTLTPSGPEYTARMRVTYE